MTTGLYKEMYEPFHFLIAIPTPDGEGGYYNRYVDGAEFEAHAAFDTTMEARTGAAAGVSSLYTVYAPVEVPLKFHSIVKRDSDGTILRITSDGGDKKTPNVATFSFQVATAAEYTPKGDST